MGTVAPVRSKVERASALAVIYLSAFTLRRRREINAVHSILSGYVFLVLKEEVLSD